MTTASRIQSAFTDTFRPLAPERAAVLAGRIAAADDLDAAIEQAGHEDAAALRDLLGLRAAQAERTDPPRLIGRLLHEAAGLDRRADALCDEAAEFFGKAAYRRARADLAAEHLARARAAEAAADDLREAALTTRLHAARVQSRADAACALCAIPAAGWGPDDSPLTGPAPLQDSARDTESSRLTARSTPYPR